jgi:hypothetical protein
LKAFDQSGLRALKDQITLCGVINAQLGQVIAQAYEDLSKAGKAEFKKEFAMVKSEQRRLAKKHLGNAQLQLFPAETNKIGATISPKDSLDAMLASLDTLKSLEATVAVCDKLGERPAQPKVHTPRFDPVKATY